MDVSKILKIANYYKQLGLNISCITNKPNEYNSGARSLYKAPSHQWKKLFYEEQSQQKVDSYDWENSTGIGTFTGRNDLRVLDIDGCDNIYFLKEILLELGLPQNYEWVVQSGSKNGFHIYYTGKRLSTFSDEDVVSTFPPKLKYEKDFEKIEFLWYTHTVLPPSIHGSGNCYSFINKTLPKAKPLSIATENIINVINKYLDFKKVETGGMYGEVFERISPKEDFVNELEDFEMAKYLLNNINCFVDIETSGLPNKSNNTFPEILQIAWILTNDEGVILKKKSYIIKSDFYLKNRSSEFVNFDFNIAHKIGIPLTEALNKFIQDIKISDCVIAHNIEFDLEVLEYHFKKLFGGTPFQSKVKICTMKSSKNYCKLSGNYGDYKYPKLSELYFSLFNGHINNSHNAEVDVLNTVRCYKKMKKLNLL